MARFARIVLFLVAGIAVAAALAVFWAREQYQEPGPLDRETTLIIAKGTAVAAIAEQLTEAGVIAEPLIFRLAVRLEGAEGALRAGEYRFPPHVSIERALTILKEGKTVVRRFTVPEGLTVREVLALLERAPGLRGTVETVPAEGSLFPETYHYVRGESRRELIARMTQARDDTLAALWAERAPGLPLRSPEEALILASIVEKETHIPEERPRVAAVFLNRLRKGMPLQADPTVAYALTQGMKPLARPLTRADLVRPSPYNTYLAPGLPPGPISNPGRAALAAVLRPAKSDALYFVADGNGGHAFARTLAEHQRNVARWRKVQRRQRHGAPKEH